MRRRKVRKHILQSDGETSKMRWVIARVPHRVLNALDDLVRTGYYKSRSEAIREILRRALDIKAKRMKCEAPSAMILKSLWMPSLFIIAIDDLVKQGLYPNRAEFIREAIRLRLRQLKAL